MTSKNDLTPLHPSQKRTLSEEHKFDMISSDSEDTELFNFDLNNLCSVHINFETLKFAIARMTSVIEVQVQNMKSMTKVVQKCETNVDMMKIDNETMRS